MRLVGRILRWTGLVLGGLIVLFLIWYWIAVPVSPPEVADTSILSQQRKQIDAHTYTLGNNWLKQDPNGLWQLYVEGAPFDRGAAAGILCQDLLHHQEEAFVEGMRKLVPSQFYQFFLKHLVAIFTRNLPDYVDLEYQEEIYGISMLASDEFDFVGPKYQRKLNFHAAHDIGHALQTQGLVAGCTMLASIPPEGSQDDFLIGRNFDFYVGDAFAEQKLITFMKPDSGIPFAMIGWPGMMGAVSGMNAKGLAVVLNAGPSKPPTRIGTPVTLLARKVVQYASTIEEARALIEPAEIFVSENIIVASGSEKRVVIFEKSPSRTVMYESNEPLVVCSNHFQSSAYAQDPQNLSAEKTTSTVYRYDRMRELSQTVFDGSLQSMADLLRNTKGIGNAYLPLGSELSVNQMTAHHALMCAPSEHLLWVACSPSQLGPFLAYNLDTLFSDPANAWHGDVSVRGRRIEADPLTSTQEYRNYLGFKQETHRLEEVIAQQDTLSTKEIFRYSRLNPAHFMTWLTLGNYSASRNNCTQAVLYYKTGLEQPLPGTHDREKLIEAICHCTPDDALCQ